MIPLALMNPKAWAVGGFALVLAVAGIQSARLGHAKGDLKAARSALVDPVTRMTWQTTATRLRSDLDTAHGSLTVVRNLLTTSNDATEALRIAADVKRTAVVAALIPAMKDAAAMQRRAEALAVFRPKGADSCAQLVDLDRMLGQGEVR